MDKNSEPLSVAIVSSGIELVGDPNLRYAGIERVIHVQQNGLHVLGHNVTLLACYGSRTPGEFVPLNDGPIRTQPAIPFLSPEENIRGRGERVWESLATAVHTLLEREVDIIHNHAGSHLLRLLSAHRITTPCVTTLHGAASDAFETHQLSRFPDQPLMCISDSQRRDYGDFTSRVGIPDLNIIRTVCNGMEITPEMCNPNPRPDGPLVFVGRLCEEKGAEEAIEIALATNRRLIIGAKVDPQDEKFFLDKIKPKLDAHPDLLDYRGELNDAQKAEVYREAYAVIMPNQPTGGRKEPFGLVCIEAGAHGAPVIVLENGALPELIVIGKTGFVCTSVSEMIALIKGRAVDSLNPQDCHNHVAANFSAKQMVDGYLETYSHVLQKA